MPTELNKKEEMAGGKIIPCLMESGIFEIQDCRDLLVIEYSDEEPETHRYHHRNLNNSTDDDSDDRTDRALKCRGKYKRTHSKNLKYSTDDDSDDRTDRALKCRGKYKRACVPYHTRNLNSADDDRVVKHRRKESPVRIKMERKALVEKKITVKEDIEEVFVNSDSESTDKKSSTPSSMNYNSTGNEISVQPVHEIYGYYFCEVCKLELSSEKVFNDHMNGKRHLKTVKLKNVSKAVAQAIPPSAATEGQSKYPKSPYGVIRKKIKEPAKIQDVIKYKVKKPCPGLHLVTEIQGFKETTYYCSICNIVCSANSILPHLTGFKHQLSLVKYFKPEAHQRISSERKNEMHSIVMSILRNVEREEGTGRMIVERDEFECYPKDTSSNVYQPSTSRHMLRTSLTNSGLSFTEYYDEATIPNKSSSDYHCKYCDAHMNNEDMWKAHIAGKRHIKNLKKMPGDLPSKTKTVPLPNARAKLLDILEEECIDEPIVGLELIREIQYRDPNSESYRCFLCSSCHTSLDIIDHILSFRHRKKYLDHINHSDKQSISDLKESAASFIVQNICAEVEADRGQGKPTVHIDKSAFFS